MYMVGHSSSPLCPPKSTIASHIGDTMEVLENIFVLIITHNTI